MAAWCSPRPRWLAGLAAIWIAPRRQRFGAAGDALVGSLALTGLWCLALVTLPAGGMRLGLLEAVCNLGWLLVLYRLFAGDGRHASFTPIRPVIVALGFVELIHLAIELILPGLAISPAGEAMVLRATAILRLLVCTGGLVMVHNLFGGASEQARADAALARAGAGRAVGLRSQSLYGGLSQPDLAR